MLFFFLSFKHQKTNFRDEWTNFEVDHRKSGQKMPASNAAFFPSNTYTSSSPKTPRIRNEKEPEENDETQYTKDKLEAGDSIFTKIEDRTKAQRLPKFKPAVLRHSKPYKWN